MRDKAAAAESAVNVPRDHLRYRKTVFCRRYDVYDDESTLLGQVEGQKRGWLAYSFHTRRSECRFKTRRQAGAWLLSEYRLPHD